MKVLVAPLGDVKKYEKVTYLWEDGSCKESKTSLSLLKEKINPQKTLLVAPDTLGVGNTYDGIVTSVEEKMWKFLEEEKIGVEDVRIIVAPAVGNFSDPLRSFRGRMRDYYSYLLYTVAEELFAEEEEIEIFIDLSHGINFMPVLTYEAIREVAGIMAIGRRVRLELYNSDPVTRGTTRVSINKVGEEKAEFFLKRSQDKGNYRLLEKRDSREAGEEDFRWTPHEGKELFAFLGAIASGLPLAVFAFYPDTSKLMQDIENSIGKWKGKIILKEEGGTSVCERSFSFTEFFETLVKAHLLTKILKLTKKEETEFGALREFYNKIFASRKILGPIIQKEIYQLERLKETGKIPSIWTLIAKIKAEEKGGAFNPQKGVDERNFFAHAGFEENSVELKAEGDIFYLRYSPENIKTVEHYCYRSFTASR